MIKNFASHATWSSDLNNLLPFYRDLLGLKPTIETPAFVVFGTLDATTFALGTHSEVKGKNPDPARHMVGFTVDDIQAEYRRLKDAGVDFIEEPTRQGESDFWIATCKDPEGNLVQLFQGQP
jgi:predicted enzyme related to lactoylglutathione lyase